MTNLRFKASLPKKATGGSLQRMQPGGVVQGPPHSQGGVEVMDEAGAPVAEVEGGERIFSIEDTAQIEEMAMGVVQAMQQDPQAAQQMATELGMAVVKMVAQQEVANPSQPPQGLPQGGAGETAMPGGSNDAYMEQPI